MEEFDAPLWERMHLQLNSHSFGCRTPSASVCFQLHLHRLFLVLRGVRVAFQAGRAHFKSLQFKFNDLLEAI